MNKKIKWILTAIILISLDILIKEFFFTYFLIIKFLLSDYLSTKLRKIFTNTMWTAVIILIGLTIYVNYGMPHGPSYPTGDIVCKYDRGPCREEYLEDLRNIDIPNWAKFIRRSGLLVMFALVFAGVASSSGGKNKNQEE